jgi:hypothetical protein
VAEDGERAALGRLQLVGAHRHRLEVAREDLPQGGAAAIVEPADQAVDREDRQARVGQGAQAHEHVAVGALAADLLGVDASRLVAVVAVGYEQLGGAKGLLDRRDRPRVAHGPQAMGRALGVGVGPPRVRPGRGLERRPRRAGGVREEREDGGEVGPSRSRQPEAVLLGAGMGALVRPDPARAVLLHPHAAEEATARAPEAVRAAVLLLERPQGGAVVEHYGALRAPAPEQLGGVRVGVGALGGPREVDVHDIVRAAGRELLAQPLVDDIVGRGGDALEPAHRGQVVAQGPQGQDLGHDGPP